MKKVIIGAYAFLFAFLVIGITAKADTHLQDPNFSWSWLENAHSKSFATEGDFAAAGNTGWDGLNPWYSTYLYGDHVVTIYNRLTGTFSILSFDNFMVKEQNNYYPFDSNDYPFYQVSPSSISGTMIAPDWNDVFPQAPQGFAIWQTTNTDYYVTADYYIEDAADLYAILADDGFDPPEPSNPWGDSEPKFYLKINSSSVMNPVGGAFGYGNGVEYTITWDTTNSYCAGREEDYGIQVAISPNNRTDNTEGIFQNWKTKRFVKQTDMYPASMALQAYVFTYRDVNTLWAVQNFTDNNFYIYVRVVDLATNTPVTHKWTWFQVAKIFELRNSAIQTEEGQDNLGESDSVGTWDPETGIFSYTDGRDPGDNTNEDGSVNINGSSVSPQASDAGVNNYSYTDPTLQNVSFGASITNLKQSLAELVSLVGNMPSILAQLLLFMPNWVTTLMATSIGLLLVVGVIKTLT